MGINSNDKGSGLKKAVSVGPKQFTGNKKTWVIMDLDLESKGTEQITSGEQVSRDPIVPHCCSVTDLCV